MDGELTLGSIGQVSLLCRSADITENWYRDVLGLPHLYTFGPLVFFDCGGTRLYFRQVTDAEWRESSTLYFLVNDIAAAYEELMGRGVQFADSPAPMHRHEDSGIEEWMAFFDDADGNTLAIMSRVPPVA